MSSIRVLFINEVAGIGGGENWILNFLSSTTDTSFEFIVLCPEGEFSNKLKENKTNVINYNFRNTDLSSHRFSAYLNFGLFRIIDFFRIRKIIKQNNIDLIHAVNVSGFVISDLIRRFVKTPVIWHVHYKINKKIYRYFRPSAAVFVADYLRKDFSLTLPDEAILNKVFYNGINCEIPYKLVERGKTRKRIGFVGRIKPEKGLNELIDAVKLLINDKMSISLQIFGKEMYFDHLKGNYTGCLKNKIKTLDLENHIEFRGFVYPQEQIYKEIDLLILPSHMEAFPFVLLEAMASGVPVIASEVGGIPEIVEHGKTGYLIPPKDSEAIADAVKHVLHNKEEIRIITDNAQKMILENFDRRKNAEQFIDLYRNVLNEQS